MSAAMCGMHIVLGTPMHYNIYTLLTWLNNIIKAPNVLLGNLPI